MAFDQTLILTPQVKEKGDGGTEGKEKLSIGMCIEWT